MESTKLPAIIKTRTMNPASEDTPKYRHNITMATTK